jgi:hypothetical protein
MGDLAEKNGWVVCGAARDADFRLPAVLTDNSVRYGGIQKILYFLLRIWHLLFVLR